MPSDPFINYVIQVEKGKNNRFSQYEILLGLNSERNRSSSELEYEQ